MQPRLTSAPLDEILALQLTVAWAGESGGDPARLGWWRTDLVDREGGGDLFSRLLPGPPPGRASCLPAPPHVSWTNDVVRRALLARVPDYRLSKFQKVLPDALQIEMVGSYLLDFAGAADFIADVSSSVPQAPPLGARSG